MGNSFRRERSDSRDGMSSTYSTYSGRRSMSHSARFGNPTHDPPPPYAPKVPLAPRMPTQNEEAPECPICFLNFDSLNKTVCCSGEMCTNCFIQMKSSRINVSCPFCTVEELNAMYTEGDDISASQSEKSDQTPCKSQKSTPLTTPSTCSCGSTTKSKSPSPIVTSSKEERKMLEVKIQQQREADRRYNYEMGAQIAYRSAMLRGNGDGNRASRRSTISTSSSTSSDARRRTRSGDPASIEHAENQEYDEGELDGDDMDVLRGIILGDQIPSLGASIDAYPRQTSAAIMSPARLEELMLEEAIKLSIAEAEATAGKEEHHENETDKKECAQKHLVTDRNCNAKYKSNYVDSETKIPEVDDTDFQEFHRRQKDSNVSDDAATFSSMMKMGGDEAAFSVGKGSLRESAVDRLKTSGNNVRAPSPIFR